MNLKNKTSLITGGSTGIGKAIAKEFMQKGAKIIIFGKNKPDYECEFHKVDVSKEEQIKSAINKVKSIDILVNNAGIFAGDTIEKTTTEEINKVIDTNIKGVFWMCKYSIYKISKGGCIINIGSISGITPRPGNSIYSLSKAAIINLTKSLALELIENEIRVNCINPGVIDTPIWLKSETSKEEGLSNLKRSATRHPMKRAGKPEEIAHATIFLAENDFTTGTILAVDGGATI
ncbi:MAG: SDR family oxidoreductase [Nanoarchaeota archaeon]